MSYFLQTLIDKWLKFKYKFNKHKNYIFERSKTIILQQYFQHKMIDDRYYKLLAKQPYEQIKLSGNRILKLSNKKKGQYPNDLLSGSMEQYGKILVKIINTHFQNTQHSIQLIKAFITASSHKSYIKMLQCIKIQGRLILIYEDNYQTLENKLTRLSQDKIIELCTLILQGLQFLHGKNFIYRYLNIKNIVIDHNNQFKLIGLALDNKYIVGQINQTKSFDIHMSPEIGLSLPYTELSDIYSFGIVLYQLLTGIQQTTTIKTEQQYKSQYKQKVKSIKTMIFKPNIVNKRFWQEILLNCLQQKAKDRLSAKQLLQSVNRQFKMNKVSNIQPNEEQKTNEQQKIKFTIIKNSVHSNKPTIKSTQKQKKKPLEFQPILPANILDDLQIMHSNIDDHNHNHNNNDDDQKRQKKQLEQTGIKKMNKSNEQQEQTKLSKEQQFLLNVNDELKLIEISPDNRDIHIKNILRYFVLALLLASISNIDYTIELEIQFKIIKKSLMDSSKGNILLQDFEISNNQLQNIELINAKLATFLYKYKYEIQYYEKYEQIQNKLLKMLYKKPTKSFMM